MSEPQTSVVITSYDPPPIPLRCFDWRAHTTSYEGGDPIGWGRTEQDAIDNLHEQLEDAHPLDIATPGVHTRGVMKQAPAIRDAIMQEAKRLYHAKLSSLGGKASPGFTPETAQRAAQARWGSVEVSGRTYASLREAAQAHGVSYRQVQYRRRKGEPLDVALRPREGKQ